MRLIKRTVSKIVSGQWGLSTLPIHARFLATVNGTLKYNEFQFVQKQLASSSFSRRMVSPNAATSCAVYESLFALDFVSQIYRESWSPVLVGAPY